MRYIIEGLGHNIDHWFTPFNKGQGNFYVKFDWATVEKTAWRGLLSEEEDRELYTLYKKGEKDSKIYTIEALPYIFNNSSWDEAKKACEILKSKSLK